MRGRVHLVLGDDGRHELGFGAHVVLVAHVAQLAGGRGELGALAPRRVELWGEVVDVGRARPRVDQPDARLVKELGLWARVRVGVTA